MRKNKNEIANELYGFDFSDLSPGEKATVTRAFNSQRESVSGAIVSASVGRVGVNGVKTCMMNAGATVADLIAQADYTLDPKKESVIALSTGRTVSLNSPVENGEEYSITVEIKSA